jgi:hypothetical protein
MLFRSRSALAVGVLAAVATLVATTTASTAAPKAAKPARGVTVAWAPAETAALHPGVMAYTDGAQCTSNFVFTDSAGGVYLGYAAHCAGTGGATETNGCEAGSLPLGTPVSFREGGIVGVTQGTEVGTGRLAYSSWLAMKQVNEQDEDACAYNDFALVKLDAGYVDDVNPSIPFWGGPVGINITGTQVGDKLYTYGNSSLRGDVNELSPHVGFSLGTEGNGWSHALYSLTPGVPGDSGSAFLDAEGNGVGTLSTLGLLPLPASNNIGDLNHELAYAKQHSGINGLALALGTEPFAPPV